jgi:outer membrane receptor protein involved in Fe transport
MPRALFSFAMAIALSAGARAQVPSASGPAGGTPVSRPTTVQQVTVTADRGLLGVNDSASSVAVLSQEQIEQSAGFTLDDALHAVSGFKLFRRTSSWSLNPTSQGVSLRGLGSTAVSRTLVVSDEIPFNDPFGGWIHWNELPLLSLDHVELIRGGAADLYGSSAIGGVVDVVPLTASAPLRFSVDGAGASESTGQGDGLLTYAARRVAVLAAASGLSTNGYVPTAPAFRGPVDTTSDVTGESARIEVRTPFAGNAGSAFLRGNLLNEARGNGSPLQTNATRLWRYQAGADASSKHWGRGVVRVYGSRESYRQSFSSITQTVAPRDTETLTKLQHVPLDEFGAVLQGSRALPGNVTAALGADLRDVRATDDEGAVTRSVVTSTTSTAAHQREVGGYADAIWQPKNWSASGSVRVDSFRTFDAQSTTTAAPGVTQLPTLTELFVSPRFGLVRRLPGGLALTGTAFRAFRAPTMNELYRTGQVGQQTTKANNALLAERATGFEFGGELARPALGTLRATYFWTEVNRPVSAVLQSSTATSQILLRENLGQIRSRGLMLEANSHVWRGLSGDVSYQLAAATVTQFNNASSPAQTPLLGKWIPEVPRHSLSTQLRYERLWLATFIVNAIYEGHEFDDAENSMALHPYARFDLYAERGMGHGFSIYASSQNALNRMIEAGKTPTPTLAAPRIVEGGVRFLLSK